MPVPSSTLELTDVVKTFPGVVALKNVDFAVVEGEVHALLGENGAGKSTLMAIAAGVLKPDRGTVEIGGQRLEHAVPALAQALGIAVVYQHTSGLEDLSVAENLRLPMPDAHRPAQRHSVTWAREQLTRVGAEFDPEVRLGRLGVAERQLVEIAKALALDSRVLVLDEPTEALTAAEAGRLFEQIERIRSSGASVVYISHRLGEARQISDRITVLRDGETVGTFAADAVSQEEILRLIVGRSVERVFPDKGGAGHGEPVLEVRGLNGRRLHDVSFAVQAGEILGLAGVEGNGQRETLRALAGLEPASGSVRVRDQAVRIGTPARSIAAGLVYLPQDRHREGLFTGLSVRENLTALSLSAISSGGLTRKARELDLARVAASSLSVKTPNVETDVETLSGGNQQKVMLARSMMPGPVVLLADEPTRGVDVGARVELYHLLRDSAAAGKGVVVVSADALELQGLCDRVLVFSRGQVVKELAGDELTEQAITHTAITAEAEHHRTVSRRRHRPSMGRFFDSDVAPSAILAAILVALAFFSDARNSLFFSERNFTQMMFLASLLLFVSYGQQIVLTMASIDLSVGPLMGLVVVIMSFTTDNGSGYGGVILGLVAVLGVGVVIGAVNAGLARQVKLPPVIATLVTYICLQGVALLLRPTPAGDIDQNVTAAIQRDIGPVPIVFMIAVAAAIAGEWALRRTRWGLRLRAVGSSEQRAHRLGVGVGRIFYSAHIICALGAVVSGVLLASQTGIGQPGLGTQYTLTSVTAVVLGGTSLFGGRASFIGSLFGALLIQEITSATTFLNLGQQWQDWLPGILIIIGAGVYSRARAVGLTAAG